VRSYEQAIVSRDGNTLCATFSPKLREVLEEQITSEQAAAGGSGSPRYDCGSYYHLLIGYPHENVDRQFVSGKFLGIGNPSRVVRAGVAYVKVPAKLRFEFTSTGYTMRSGVKGAATVEDTVWLSKGKDGTWGVVKPSLALVAASNPDVLFDKYSAAPVNTVPPDPDYSMNRAERTAWEAADYKASFRKLGDTPPRCDGKTVSVQDSLHDAVLYPRGTRDPVAAPEGNDIERVAVQASRVRICVAVTFRMQPEGDLRIGFGAGSSRSYAPGYVIEVKKALGGRGGVLTSGYRYFTGGEKLLPGTIVEISLSGRTVAFALDLRGAYSFSRVVPADLGWAVSSSASTGSDRLPNQPPGQVRLIRQSDQRVVNPAVKR
jgi:hypothetical protein